MDKVHILVEGYAHPGKDGSYIASPSTVLIQTNDKNILVDPGAVPFKKLEGALVGLKNESLSFIYLSHYHPDHFLNIKYFPNLEVYDGTTLWTSDKEIFYEKRIPDTDIEILPGWE